MTTDVRATGRGPLLAAFVPFAAALVFMAIGVRPIPATATPSRPALAFDEYVVNMGPYPVEPRPVIGARFQFTNRSDTDITISRLEPSCGCLSPQIEKKTWAAGETGELDLRVSTVGQAPGPHEYTMRLAYGTPGSGIDDQTELTLGFKVVFPEQKIVVQPRSLLFYQLGEKPIEQDVVISDHRGDRLEIKSISTGSEFVTAKHVGETIHESGGKRITVRVTVSGSVPAGQTRALVNLHTNDDRFPVLQVPLLIKGPARPERLAIRAEPALLILSSQDDGGQLIGAVQLMSSQGKPVKIRSVRADPSIIQAVYSADDRTPGSVTISASIPEERVTGFNRGMLTIETDEPQRGRIEVPIMLRVPPKPKSIGPAVVN
jgi:hypothetical protein